MSVTALPLTVTEPGLYAGIPEDTYHADPVPGGSLSQSGMKLLLPPSCPARFRWEQDHPATASRAMDFGTAAHRKVLGVGQDIAALDFPDRRTKAYREAVAEAEQAGRLPLLASEARVIDDMAAQLAAHPIAGRLFADGAGTPEVSAFWREPFRNVMLRARFDWLPSPDRQLILTDYKTARTADPDEWVRLNVLNYGYFIQEFVYRQITAALYGADIRDTSFVFVVQEPNPPYLVSVVQLPDEAAAIGRIHAEVALDIYAECTASGHWPGYAADGIAHPALPEWFTRKWLA